MFTAKVAVFTCTLDYAQIETERTALIKNMDEIRGEEEHLAKVRHFLTFPLTFSTNPILTGQYQSVSRIRFEVGNTYDMNSR
jgi:hypothetical protein